MAKAYDPQAAINDLVEALHDGRAEDSKSLARAYLRWVFDGGQEAVSQRQMAADALRKFCATIADLLDELQAVEIDDGT